MTTLRDLQDRITSVEKTKKMTQAMKMVAASKFKRATNRLDELTAYSDSLTRILEKVSSHGLYDDVPALLAPNSSANQLVIAISGDRGLCGGFNTTVIKAVDTYINQTKDPLNFILIGNKISAYLKSKNHHIDGTYSNIIESLSIDTVSSIMKPIIDQYNQNEIGRVVVIRQEFQSALSSRLVTEQLLPIDMSQFKTQACEKITGDYLYEPSKQDTLENLVKMYLSFKLYRALIESSAGEEGARMAAMESATSNAGDMINDLNLVYNRTRQAAITTELTEIVAGAEALVS